jgi:choline dehydrogenase-like flavoprotein
MRAARHCFSDRERAALITLARAAMPAGQLFSAGGEDCVDRVEGFLLHAPPAVVSGFRAMILALEGAALLHFRRPLSRLVDDQVMSLLERWRQGDYLRRTMLKLLTGPLKVAHYNDPKMYESVGCAFTKLPVAQVERPRHMVERVASAESVDDDETLECDVVVIGTGAGGAVTARELAERGHAVVLLEEGEYHQRDSFNGRPFEMQKKLYRDMGATVSVGNVSIPIPIGKSVGGTTTINSGTCYRAPARIFDAWRSDFGLGLSDVEMAPHYARVEEVMGVDYAQAKYLGGVGRVIARGCDALGYAHKPLRRNAPDCDGQGVCCFGCPTDAKRSTNVSYVPMALKAGAQLFTGAKVDRVLVERKRAAGVRVRAGNKTFTVRARAVVVACGSLLTPLLLEKSGVGLSSGQLGRNLSIHPALAALAVYDEVIDGANAIPQGYAIEEFHDEGLLFEGAFAPLDVGAASFPLIGHKLVDLLEDYRRLACFGFMIEDTSRGRVRPGPGGRPLITYWMNDHDVARLKRGVEILSRVFMAGGARRVIPLVNGFDELKSEHDLETFRRAKLTARDFELSAYHPLGTARMGADAKRSVIGADHQVHDTPGVYVTDGSALPSSPAVNPQLTIMALATRAATHIDRALSSS